MTFKASRKNQKLGSTSSVPTAKRARLIQHSFSPADLSSYARLLQYPTPTRNSRSQRIFQSEDSLSNHLREQNRFNKGGPVVDFQTPFTEFEQSTQATINTLRRSSTNAEPKGIISNQRTNEKRHRHSVRFFAGPQVTRLNEKLEARAFTIGQDIFLHDNAVGNTSIVEHEIIHAYENNDSMVFFWRDLARVIQTMRTGLNEPPGNETELRGVLRPLLSSAERGTIPIEIGERRTFVARFRDFPQRLADCLIRMAEAGNLRGSFRNSQEEGRHYLRYWLGLVYSGIQEWTDLQIEQQIDQAYYRIVTAPPRERRLDRLEPDLVLHWRRYWEDQSAAVPDTKALALYILGRYWNITGHDQDTVPERDSLSALGFAPSLSIESGWYNSLNIVDPSLDRSRDQISRWEREVIEGFWNPLAVRQRNSLDELLEQALAAQLSTAAIAGSQEEARRVGQRIIDQMREDVVHWSTVSDSLAPANRIRVNAVIECYQHNWSSGNPCSGEQCGIIGLEIPATRAGSYMRVREVETSETSPPSSPSGCGCVAPGAGGSNSGLSRFVRLFLGLFR